LLSVFEEIEGNRANSDLSVVYLTMDRVYRDELRKSGINVFAAYNVLHMIDVCRSAAIVTDHGPHALLLLLKFTDMPFFDVWHGIPFKGFDKQDFKYLPNYRKLFVASPSMKRMYEEKFGFRQDQILVTGYGRTDKLVNGGFTRNELMNKYGLATESGRIVLLAPTWHHDRQTRRVMPFGWEVDELMEQLTEFTDKTGHLIIFRLHLNSPSGNPPTSRRIRFMASDDYPVAEEILALSDVLVSDWSSIVFDFLLLRRPTVFVDSEPPFKKGFSYGPENRFGPLVRTPAQLITTLARICDNPVRSIRSYEKKMDAVIQDVYGDFADGRAGKRYVENIVKYSLGDSC
jgi:CDP-glycerol glycerophosphotransferase